MDEREGAKLPTSAEATEAYAEELADDPEALAELIDLHFQHLDAFPS